MPVLQNTLCVSYKSGCVCLTNHAVPVLQITLCLSYKSGYALLYKTHYALLYKTHIVCLTKHTMCVLQIRLCLSYKSGCACLYKSRYACLTNQAMPATVKVFSEQNCCRRHRLFLSVEVLLSMYYNKIGCL